MAELILKNSKKHGKGIFADKDFKKNEKIMELHGGLYTYQQLPFPYFEVEDRYVQIGQNLYMGPPGGLDDFVNHSCNPNAGLKINGKKVDVIAVKNIKTGEEITWDYSTTMDEDDWEMDCLCGSQNCRKRVRDFKYLPKDTQKKYIELGIIPEYILRKI
ncbi:MAG: SET domain-containing protein-lysine N-methyltransferase [Nanoarchaeota archaeon]|mgnify:CR=1 FL=1